MGYDWNQAYLLTYFGCTLKKGSYYAVGLWDANGHSGHNYPVLVRE